jgi:CheY-like chemotaxis protein
MHGDAENVQKILLVEDDDGHALLIKSALRKTGFHSVRWLRDGEEALEFLFGTERGIETLESNCVVLLDIRMPRVDGVEVLRRIREIRGHESLPVVMVTTTDDPAEMARCSRIGCNSYLVKPVEPNRLAAALERIRALRLPNGEGAGGPLFA